MINSRNDHNLGPDANRGQVDLDLANAQYKSEWPELCKQLTITPFMLNRIDPRILIALMLVRMNSLYALKMMDLESRIHKLENANAGPLANPPRSLIQ